MKKLLRKWLGIDALESRVVSLLVDFGRMTPEEAAEIINEATKPDFKLINNHGEEGQL